MSETPPPNDLPAPSDPIVHFRAWLDDARRIDRARLPEPTAMTVASVNDAGHPSVRIVLLKDVDERGFVFYTNLNSRKGRELLAHPRAALCFYWPPLERQIRIEGTVEPVSDAEADAYFASRARESQIGAWASQQSEALASMDELRARVRRCGSALRRQASAAPAALVRPPREAARASSSGTPASSACTSAAATSATATGGQCGVSFRRRKRYC